jgi:ubiquinone/menaquinone biosynthesis C-methylase UbiE
MSDPSLQAQVDAATTWEEFCVPALGIAAWASRVADAAHLQAGDRVLDVACGTGVLARAAAARVRAGGSVAGVDINPGALSVAARVAPEIEWRQGAAESLPYADAAFHAVVSQFGLTFFADRQAALREMMRVLAPGGHLAVAVWGTLDDTPGYAAFVACLQPFIGEQATAVVRSPFALGDPRELSALFATAGMASAVVTSQRGTARFSTLRAWVQTDIKRWLRIAQVRLDEGQFAALLAEAERALRSFVTANGTVEFAMPAHIVTARKA